VLRNIRFTLQYDGTNYHGWQIQPNAVTIQEILESTLGRVVSHPVRVTGAGRTDAGVHARGQVASFRTESSIPPEKLKRALNGLLPDDIKVLEITEADPGFDARRSAQGKIYRYFILNSPEPSPWLYRYSWHFPSPLDCEAMQTAAGHLVGRREYSSFQASDGNTRSSVRKIEFFTVNPQRSIITFEVKADGFLKHMVRGMVGTLVEVGRGRFSPRKVEEILSAQDRTQAGPNAPARGLFLWKVVY